MNRKILTLLFFSAVAAAAWAQPTDSGLLTQHNWTLTTDEMSGIVKHHSQPGNTQLHFTEDGKWKAEPAIGGVSEGAWVVDKKGRVLMQFGPKKKAKVIKSGPDQLKIRIGGLSSVRVLTWKASK